MTLLFEPPLYNVAHVVFRVIFGVGASDLIYEERRKLAGGRKHVWETSEGDLKAAEAAKRRRA